MAQYTFKDGRWLDKATGEPVELPSKEASWQTPGKFHITPDIDGYTCPITNEWVGSRAAHRENLKRHGCRILETGETRDAHKQREREFERAIDRTARELVSRYADHFE